jgi:hypothetical protein
VPDTLPKGRRFARTAGSPPPLLSSTPRSVALVSWQGAGAPCQAPTPRLACASCWKTSCGSWGSRPLRPPASLLHNAALPSVPSSRCAKAPLGAGHRWSALRVKATGVMQSGLRWSGRQSSALPGPFAPYAPPSVALLVCWRCGIYQALCAMLWSAASPCILYLPPPTLGACLLRSIARAVCPSAPQGGSLRTAPIHAAWGRLAHIAQT